VQTNEYAPGRLVDVFGEPADPAVLLWHGTQTDARTTLRPFATLIADHGYRVIVPDWNSHADDNGRDDLLRSLRYATDAIASGQDFVLIGWSLGGTAAAAVALHPAHFDSPVSRVICLAGAFGAVSPLTGDHLPTDDLQADNRIPLILLHGAADDVVPPTASEEFAAALGTWPVQLALLDADHGSIAGAVYESSADRYRAAEDPAVLAVAGGVVDRMIEILGSDLAE
jgi:dienelactone hydrolase